MRNADAVPGVKNEDVDGEEERPRTFPDHAMFLRDDDGPETRDIVWIQLKRRMPDGTVLTCPDLFRATDLPHWGEVYRRFGGGKYKAKGYNAKMQWQAEAPGGNDWIVFDGASRTFAVNPVEEPTGQQDAASVESASSAAQSASQETKSGLTLAEAIVSLGGVITSVATALINRPAPAALAAPDNMLAVTMMNHMAAQSQAAAKATSDILLALLSRDNTPDNSSLVAVLNAGAETTRVQAEAQNAILAAVLSQKPPGLAELAKVIATLGRGAPAQGAGGLRDTIETIKAVREISGPAQSAAGPSELGEVASMVRSLAGLDKGGSKERERERETEKEEPRPRRDRILMHTEMGLIEVLEPSPELLRHIFAPAPSVAPAVAPSPTPASVSAIGATPAAPVVEHAPSRAVAPPPAIEAPAAPLSEDEELVRLAAMLRSDPRMSARLAQLLRDAPAEPAGTVAATPHDPSSDVAAARSPALPASASGRSERIIVAGSAKAGGDAEAITALPPEALPFAAASFQLRYAEA